MRHFKLSIDEIIIELKIAFAQGTESQQNVDFRVTPCLITAEVAQQIYSICDS